MELSAPNKRHIYIQSLLETAWAHENACAAWMLKMRVDEKENFTILHENQRHAQSSWSVDLRSKSQSISTNEEGVEVKYNTEQLQEKKVVVHKHPIFLNNIKQENAFSITKATMATSA